MILSDLQGHWRRNWIRAPGLEDTTTRVHWLQAGRWCADIRIPLLRPGLGRAKCLADLAPADLATLLGAEGFCGHVTLDADICTWTRTRNWRGFPCPVDAGRLWFDADGHLIEDGVHADYREEWQRRPAPPFTAEAAEADSGDGLLISHASTFLLALGHDAAPAWPALAQSLRDGTATPRDAAPAFASVYILGHWQDGAGIADLSTQPFCEGHAVLTRSGPTARLALPDIDGRIRTQDLRLSPLPQDD